MTTVRNKKWAYDIQSCGRFLAESEAKKLTDIQVLELLMSLEAEPDDVTLTFQLRSRMAKNYKNQRAYFYAVTDGVSVEIEDAKRQCLYYRVFDKAGLGSILEELDEYIVNPSAYGFQTKPM